jgi:hypothetical protein
MDYMATIHWTHRPSAGRIGVMTTQNTPIAFSAAPLLTALRAAFRRQAAPAADRDVARELPGYPETGRAGFAISLLADDRRHLGTRI